MRVFPHTAQASQRRLVLPSYPLAIITSQQWDSQTKYYILSRRAFFKIFFVRRIVRCRFTFDLDVAADVDGTHTLSSQFDFLSSLQSHLSLEFPTGTIRVMVLLHHPSIDCKGRATDNICIECFWRSAKCERIYLNEYGSVPELRVDVADYIEFYNHRRFHESLGYKKPMNVYKEGTIGFKNQVQKTLQAA